MFKIRTKILLLMIPVTLALLGALGYLNYLKSSEMLTREAGEHLQAIVGSKQAALIEYFESAEKIGGAIALTDIVQTGAELANRNLGGANQQTVDQLTRRVDNLIYSLQATHWGRYRHIYLIDRSNRIAISPNHGIREKATPSALLGRDMSRNPWAMAAMQKGLPSITKYTNPEATEDWQQTLFFPVRDSSNRVQAVIGIELQVSYQRQILARGLGEADARRILLATDRGVAISQARGSIRAPLTGDAVAEAKLSGAATARRVNEQGREVIGHYVKHPDYPWLLAAEIETTEIFAKLHELQILLAAGLAATLMLLALLVTSFANGLVKPLRELTSRVEMLSLGKFGTEIPEVRRRDEIGKLVEAFHNLVFSLQLAAKKLREAKAMKKAG